MMKELCFPPSVTGEVFPRRQLIFSFGRQVIYSVGNIIKKKHLFSMFKTFFNKKKTLLNKKTSSKSVFCYLYTFFFFYIAIVHFSIR